MMSGNVICKAPFAFTVERNNEVPRHQTNSLVNASQAALPEKWRGSPGAKVAIGPRQHALGEPSDHVPVRFRTEFAAGRRDSRVSGAGPIFCDTSARPPALARARVENNNSVFCDSQIAAGRFAAARPPKCQSPLLCSAWKHTAAGKRVIRSCAFSSVKRASQVCAHAGKQAPTLSGPTRCEKRRTVDRTMSLCARPCRPENHNPRRV
jgi:hypothetical protein